MVGLNTWGPSFIVCSPHTVAVDFSRTASQSVREDTAELASLALSDMVSNRKEHSPARLHTSSTARRKSDAYFGDGGSAYREPSDTARRDTFEEAWQRSTPHSSNSSCSSLRSRCQSALTEIIKNSPPTEGDIENSDGEEHCDSAAVHPVTVREGIISQPSERTNLLAKRTAYGSFKDIESQKIIEETQTSKRTAALQNVRMRAVGIMQVAISPKSWNWHDVCEYGIRQPAQLLAPVLLGLLLNILDALSYGRWEFQGSMWFQADLHDRIDLISSW